MLSIYNGHASKLKLGSSEKTHFESKFETVKDPVSNLASINSHQWIFNEKKPNCMIPRNAHAKFRRTEEDKGGELKKWASEILESPKTPVK
jgi:hypothetical protein